MNSKNLSPTIGIRCSNELRAKIDSLIARSGGSITITDVVIASVKAGLPIVERGGITYKFAPEKERNGNSRSGTKAEPPSTA